MSTMEICPEESVIAAWLGGEIDEDIAESIGDHVDGCETCFGRTTRLEANPDGIAQFLQDAVAEAPPEVTGDLLPSRYPQTLQNIGEYKVIERLGSGGMGAVFVAMHGRLRRSVALKVLSERSANDQRAIARFNREMEVVGRLNHPNIVQALDAGEADGTNYLAMELLNGADLSRVLTSSKTLSVPDATEIARQAALGLNYAHDRGMIHRDVKPSNLMLARENDGRTRVKILDLGLAIIQESAPDAELTDAGQLMGTLEYMAPEQTEDTHSVDHTADIYALGSTLYRMLVGHVPFSGEVWNTPAKRLKGLLNHDAPGIRETRPDLPDELITLIDSMLKRDVTDRPRSMREVAEALLPFSITHKISELPGIASSTASVATTHGIHSAFDDTQRTVRTTVEPVAAKWAKPGLIVAVCLIAILSFPALSAIRSWMATAPSVSDADRTDEVRTTTPDAPKDTSVRVKASQGLIGLWSFENSDDGLNRDLSGHARHGTMTGSPAKSAGAPIPDNKTSQEFGHKGGETTISHHETLSCPDTMSIAFWLRRGHAYNRAEIPIIEKQGSFTVAIVGAKQTEESKVRLICRIAGSDNETVIASSRSIRRAWQHVALTHDGTQLTLYINGQPNNTVPITHGIATTSSDLVLGNSGNRDLSGDIDEVCLYNRVLTERDVISLTRSRPAPAMAVAPFDSAEAMAFQSAWSEHLELPVEFTNNVGITMRLIPPGEFQMGVRDSDIETLIGWHAKKKKTRDSYKAELPRHTVRISQPFYLGVHEVTQQEYHAVTGEMPAFFPSETTVKYLGDLTNDEFPVERISWNDCVEFCNQLAASNGSPPCYEQSDDSWVRLDNPGYRLPTEAEWEYSCRAGTESMWSYGGRYSDYESSEWAVPNSEATTRPVGQLQPNAFGLFDMHGNVFEWCQDWFKPKEYKTRSDLPAVDPTGPESGTRRVYRGGSWWQRRTQSRSSFRGSHFPGFSYKEHGFRIVLDVSAARVVTESKTIAAVRKWAGK